jgi:hypothetical protein
VHVLLAAAADTICTSNWKRYEACAWMPERCANTLRTPVEQFVTCENKGQTCAQTETKRG